MWIDIKPVYRACYDKIFSLIEERNVIKYTFVLDISEKRKRFDWKKFRRVGLTYGEAVRYLTEHPVSGLAKLLEKVDDQKEKVMNIKDRAVEASLILDNGKMFLTDDEYELIRKFMKTGDKS